MKNQEEAQFKYQWKLHTFVFLLYIIAFISRPEFNQVIILCALKQIHSQCPSKLFLRYSCAKNVNVFLKYTTTAIPNY